jgi:hypothetical protein
MEKDGVYEHVHEVYSSAAETTVNALAAQGWRPLAFGWNADERYFAWMEKGGVLELVHEVYSSAAETTVNALAVQGWRPLHFGWNGDDRYFAWMKTDACP